MKIRGEQEKRRNSRLLRERKRKKKDEEMEEKEKKTKKSTRSTTSCVYVQIEEVSSNERAACLGLYEEDISDGELMCEWIQCTGQYCNKWMHSGYLQGNEDGLYKCHCCSTNFL